MNTTRYEFGMVLEFDDERTGAASLWMVSMKMGEAEASSGNSEAQNSPFIMTVIPLRTQERWKGYRGEKSKVLRDMFRLLMAGEESRVKMSSGQRVQ